jgi:dihydrolipoamide dehydrogenase
LGFKVAVKKRKAGGVCLNWGCIPTKALKSAQVFYYLKHALIMD